MATKRKPAFHRTRAEYVGRTVAEVGYEVRRMVHPLNPYSGVMVAVLPDGTRAAAVCEADESGDPVGVLAGIARNLRMGLEYAAFRDDYLPG